MMADVVILTNLLCAFTGSSLPPRIEIHNPVGNSKRSLSQPLRPQGGALSVFVAAHGPLTAAIESEA